MAASIHRQIRDAVAAALEGAFADEGVDVTVLPVDSPNPRLSDFPAVQVWPAGDPQVRGGTNARDDIAYPVAVGLYTVTADPDTTAAGNDPPGLHPSDFHQLTRRLFHNRRALAADGIGGVHLLPQEWDGQPPVMDTVSPDAIDQLRAAVTITVTAREPRGL